MKPEVSKDAHSSTMLKDFAVTDGEKVIADGSAVYNKLDAGKDKPSEKAEAGLDRGGEAKTPEQIKKDYGVDVVQVDGKDEYHLKSYGKDQVLFKTDHSEAGMKEADEKLKELVQEKEKSLEGKFGVAFAKPGEDAMKQYADGPNGREETDKMIKSRAPRLDELDGLEAGLMHSQPSNKTISGDPLKMYFLNDHPIKDSDTGDAAYKNDQAGKPAVFFDSNFADAHRPTDADPGRGKSMEAIVTHELTHNGQRNIDQNPVKDVAASELGWQKSVSDPPAWLLETKNGDLYRKDPTLESNWYKCDASGKALDSKGQPAAGTADRVPMNTKELYDQAKVSPPSHYFDDPTEEMAEAMTRFRSSPDWRADLLQHSPEGYEVAKKFDQEEIDKFYPTRDGQSTMIRGVSGELVANSAESRAAVDQFEQRYRLP
jgi:hypothetical protein